MTIPFRRAAVICMAGLVLGWSPGCASPPAPRGPQPMTGPDGAPSGTVGDVISVNAGLGYVIVQGQNLPTSPGRARVFRDGLVVGSVQFDGTPEPPFASADIVTGEIQPGDRVVP